jgi:hypothetical protein
MPMMSSLLMNSPYRVVWSCCRLTYVFLVCGRGICDLGSFEFTYRSSGIRSLASELGEPSVRMTWHVTRDARLEEDLIHYQVQSQTSTS